MRGKAKLTLGNCSIILGSTSKIALRAFTKRIYPRAEETFFDPNGVVAGLNDPKSTELRNRAAHDETVSKEEAGYMRIWALRARHGQRDQLRHGPTAYQLAREPVSVSLAQPHA
jgi:hypothetical protein